jgi:hypothetical protein
MRKDLKLKSADCGWRSAVSTGPTGGTVASGHAHHWMAFLRRARVNSEHEFRIRCNALPTSKQASRGIRLRLFRYLCCFD